MRFPSSPAHPRPVGPLPEPDTVARPPSRPRELIAHDLALAAAAQPNAVTDELFAQLRSCWSEGEIVELLGVVAMFGFLNRWNDSMATTLEPLAVEVAERAVGGVGWQAGKHG